MERLSLWIAIILGVIVSAVWVICFAWIFWLLGVKNISNKWDAFMDAIIFNKRIN